MNCWQAEAQRWPCPPVSLVHRKIILTFLSKCVTPFKFRHFDGVFSFLSYVKELGWLRQSHMLVKKKTHDFKPFGVARGCSRAHPATDHC